MVKSFRVKQRDLEEEKGRQGEGERNLRVPLFPCPLVWNAVKAALT
jgi:hypothetical protein